MAPIPIILLTGYLGAGKTSLLNHVLTLPQVAAQDVALIINDFGSENVDGGLVPEKGHVTFELNKGSVFCICIKTEFVRTLRMVADVVKPDLVIVEATGVADPCDLADFLDVPGLEGKFELRATVCLVDVPNFSKVAAYMKAAQNQVLWADGIVLNKIDLAEHEDVDRVAEIVQKLNPEAPQVRVTHGRIPEDFLGSLTHRSHKGVPSEQPPEGIVSVSLQFDGPVQQDAFLAALENLGDTLLRAKGGVDFGDGLMLVESVFGRVSIKTPPAGSALRPGFVMILQGVDPEEVRKQWCQTVPGTCDGNAAK